MDHAGRTGRAVGIGRSALLAALVFVGAASLAWYRLGPVARGTAWAEDGGLFLRERLAYGVDGTLFRPYAGYLHLLPRLIVDLGVARPIADYALTVSGAAVVVVGIVCAAVFLLARDVVPSAPLRLVLAAVPVVLPIVPYEVSGNVANLHWFMLFLSPWLFAFRPRSWWAAGAVTVLTVAAVLTEPQTLLFLPLLLLAWLPNRSVGLRALPVTVAALGAGTAQAVAVLTTPRDAVPGSPGVGDAAAGFLLQPVAGTWTADLGAVGRAVATQGWDVLAVPAIAVAVVVVVALALGPWRARLVVLALCAGAVGIWAAALLANAGADAHWLDADAAALEATSPARYAVAPGMFVVAAAVVAASVLVEPAGWVWRRRSGTRTVACVVGGVLGWCVVVAVVVSAVTNVQPGTTRRSDGPTWAGQFTSAVTRECRAHPSRVLQVKTQPWGASVPCALVLGERR